MQRVREQVQVPEQLHSGAGCVKSVTVAVLDTGIAYHPDLIGRLLAFSDFVEGRSFPYDDNGHGTHVCGIVCGSGELSGGRFRGMAPEAKLVVGKVLDRQGEGSCDSMQEALEGTAGEKQVWSPCSEYLCGDRRPEGTLQGADVAKISGIVVGS